MHQVHSAKVLGLQSEQDRLAVHSPAGDNSGKQVRKEVRQITSAGDNCPEGDRHVTT